MKDNSESIEIKQAYNDTKIKQISPYDDSKALDDMVTHPSPEKFVSAEKVALKKTIDPLEPEHLDPDSISKINLEPVADLEA